MRFFLKLWLFFPATLVFAESPYLSLFETARERMRFGLEGQKAREALALSKYQRASRLAELNSISREEFEQIKAAEILAALDVEISEIKIKQADIALGLMQGLSQAGRRIPVCPRRVKKPRPELTRLVKPKKPPPVPLSDPNTGTQIKIQPEVPPPVPPEQPNPSEPQEPPSVEPPVPNPPDVPDLPEPPGPKPPPKPPGPRPGPKPAGGK